MIVPYVSNNLIIVNKYELIDVYLENCGFGYQCPMLIGNLEYKSFDIRHCNKCDKDVHVVGSVEQLRQYVQLGRCVAFKVEDDGGVSTIE